MSNDQPKQGMQTGTKILIAILALIGVSFVLCCGGAFFYFKNAFQIDQTPEGVIAAQNEIASIEIPETYKPLQSIKSKMLGMSMNMVIFQRKENPTSGSIILMSMTLPTEGSEDAFDQSIEEQLDQQGQNQNIEVEETETKTFTIDGEERKFAFNKGTSDGKPVRQVTGSFKNRSGTTTMFILVEDEDVWDEEQAVKIIESISAK